MTDSGDTGAPGDTSSTDTSSTDTSSTDTGTTDTGPTTPPVFGSAAEMAGELGGFHCATVAGGGWGVALVAALLVGWMAGRVRSA